MPIVRIVRQRVLHSLLDSQFLLAPSCFGRHMWTSFAPSTRLLDVETVPRISRRTVIGSGSDSLKLPGPGSSLTGVAPPLADSQFTLSPKA